MLAITIVIDAVARSQPIFGTIDVRSDLLRRLRASPPASPWPSSSSSWRGRRTCSPRWGDYTYRERHGEAIYRFKSLPSRRRGRHAAERLLPPQSRLELPGGRHRHSPTPTLTRPRLRGRVRVGGVDNMMWGLDYPRSESTFRQSRKILAEILRACIRKSSGSAS
jgi:hypothetical protein